MKSTITNRSEIDMPSQDFISNVEVKTALIENY
jgi:hypothetical protein